MKYLASLALLCVVGHLAYAAPSDTPVDCSKLAEIIEDRGSAQSITTLNDKYKLSTTLEDYNKRCTEMLDSIKILKKYNKECYKSLTQQVFGAILRTRATIQEARCVLGAPETKEAQEASACIQENAFEKVKEAERKTILSSQILLDMNIPDDKLRLRSACCGVIASKGYFMDAIKEKCSKYEKVYNDYVDSYMSEAMSLICPSEDKLECNKLEPLKFTGVEPTSKFFLTPMIKVIQSLDH